MRIPVIVGAALCAVLGIILLALGISSRSTPQLAFGVALILSALVALISALSARTTRPGEVQPGIAFEGMAWWALGLIALFLVGAGVVSAVA